MAVRLHSRRGRTRLVANWPRRFRRFFERRLRRRLERGRKFAAIVELDAAETAMIQTSAHQALDQIENASVHLVDFVGNFQFGDAVGATARAAAAVAKMELV